MPIDHTPPSGRNVPTGSSAATTKPASSTTKLSVLRGQRTRQRKHLNSTIAKAREFTQATADTTTELSELLSSIQRSSENIREADHLIVHHPDFNDDNLDAELDEAEEYRVAAADCCIFVERLLADVQARLPNVTGVTSAPTSSGAAFGWLHNAGSSTQSHQAPSITCLPPPARLNMSPDVFSGDRTMFRQYTDLKEQAEHLYQLNRPSRQDPPPPPASSTRSDHWQRHRPPGQQQQPQHRREDRPTHNPPRQPPHFAAKTTVAAPAVQSRKKPCFFCKDRSHNPSRCSSNVSHQERRRILDQLNRCHTCFRPRHGEDERCPGVLKACLVCQSERHYTSMHQRDGLAEAATSGVTVTSASSVLSSSILMTAAAHVVHGGKRLPVRIFLDPGSNLSFAHPSLIQQLPGTRPLSKVDPRVQGFADARTITAQRHRIRLASYHNDKVIGAVKRALFKTLGRSLDSFEGLRTTVCDLAGLFVDVPLTDVESGLEVPPPGGNRNVFSEFFRWVYIPAGT